MKIVLNEKQMQNSSILTSGLRLSTVLLVETVQQNTLWCE